jgi:hypothetical protein
LNNLALVISRSSISIGTVRLDPWNLTQVIVQREILKMAIFMASVDQDFDPLEMAHLASLASDMGDNLADFPDDVAEAVLIAVINMATSDGIVKSSEYEAIIERSNQFKRPSSEIDNLIIEKCRLKGTTPPPQLQQRYDQEIGRHQGTNHNMS